MKKHITKYILTKCLLKDMQILKNTSMPCLSAAYRSSTIKLFFVLVLTTACLATIRFEFIEGCMGDSITEYKGLGI